MAWFGEFGCATVPSASTAAFRSAVRATGECSAQWTFWQFNNGGRVEGIENRVDLDAFRGSLDELKALTSSAPRAP